MKQILNNQKLLQNKNCKLIKLALFDTNQVKCYFDDNTSLIMNDNFSNR